MCPIHVPIIQGRAEFITATVENIQATTTSYVRFNTFLTRGGADLCTEYTDFEDVFYWVNKCCIASSTQIDTSM